MSTKEFGNLGERIAENYLKNKGYQILDKNYSFWIAGSPRKGEIDIVAKKDDTISFVEVKTLRLAQGRFISPEEKVNFLKQRKLRMVDENWLMKKKLSLNQKWQIDVIAIEVQNGRAKISHFENAVPYY